MTGVTRRGALGLFGAGAIGGAGAAGAAGDAAGAGAGTRAAPPDLSFLREGPLVNAPRMRELMARAGLDALVVTHPANVFHLTGHWPQLDRMGLANTAIAVFPRDPARPTALVMHAFLHYYTHSDETPAGERVVFTYTQPAAAAPAPAAPTTQPATLAAAAGGEPAAVPARTYTALDEARVSDREKRRRAAAAAVRSNSAGPDWALAKALRELRLDGATLGVDDFDLAEMIGARGLGARCVGGENTLRRARLVKSERELRLMRIAARNNVEAAMAAARRARASGTTRMLRADFFAEAARRGNAPVFMVVDQSSSEVMDAPLRDGQAFAIDCVSSCRFYHGDFARTVFVGEPDATMKRVVAATLQAWRDIQGSLRAGLRFADIPRIGRESLARQGAEFSISFTPHSVGLFHTDHPYPTIREPQPPEALVLEEGMILSVDCPLGNVGAGGSSHLEDLMLIRKDGAEPIHEVPANVIIV
jgi:Xaa-Pro aminopeptidase